MARRRTDLVAERDLSGAPAAPVDPALPKTGQAYAFLRRAIVGLALPPGAAIDEKRLCDRLGMSRTPLREAVLRLRSENLVTIVPNAGTYVTRIDLASVFDGQLVREALEMKIVRLAAAGATEAFVDALDANLRDQARMAAAGDHDGFYESDEAFHAMVAAFGASDRVWRIVNGAKAQLDRVRRMSIPVPSHHRTVLSEHAAIARGIAARDPDAAAAAMQVHLDRVFEMIRRHLAERGEYFAADSGELLDRHPKSR